MADRVRPQSNCFPKPAREAAMDKGEDEGNRDRHEKRPAMRDTPDQDRVLVGEKETVKRDAQDPGGNGKDCPWVQPPKTVKPSAPRPEKDSIVLTPLECREPDRSVEYRSHDRCARPEADPLRSRPDRLYRRSLGRGLCRGYWARRLRRCFLRNRASPRAGPRRRTASVR